MTKSSDAWKLARNLAEHYRKKSQSEPVVAEKFEGSHRVINGTPVDISPAQLDWIVTTSDPDKAEKYRPNCPIARTFYAAVLTKSTLSEVWSNLHGIGDVIPGVRSGPPYSPMKAHLAWIFYHQRIQLIPPPMISNTSITSRQIKAAYKFATQVFESKLTANLAVKKLHDEFALNTNSARDFIGQLRHMLQGEVFKRTMSASAMQYFLRRILEDRGMLATEQALISVWKHIEYYEDLGKGKLDRMRYIVEEFQAGLHEPLDVSVLQASFVSKVQRSLRDETTERRKRLNAAAKIPKLLVATTRIFVRNPDVVAEVLHRAHGKCEHCKRPAPFLRRSNKSPYLEVHHRIQLAAGGQDSIENAIALCPNCHRMLHYGSIITADIGPS
jgi:5-methylcytosine-specific restriction protein A